MTNREELKAIEDRLSLAAWDVTSRAPSMGEVNRCRVLRGIVGQRWDSVNRTWEALEAEDTELVK